ncbi:Protein-L-isoaspartate O-methyltransferase [Anaerohalosphaera lusitana]|uniref:Protein-L-isoaspartate O-methyltransferase n=1 Tax=Anaerohalosphaera lusitana TaxID=1936003 RepID=A0A1U9NH78_9BACT|nr:protein-L-isoaspartate(D-aspartate) O-methyltransferase [Anaerohalosphaera lusitana]AQT67155.1 Protein-L-isoaspartate O-methyltransferase [Anaerohalosphaera lusitana]
MVSINAKAKHAVERRKMVQHQLAARGINDPAVLEAFEDIPREIFLPPQYESQAYHDNPVPIGSGQTISQPYIVALMTEKLQLDKNCDVLELGTGSGYQTAILATIARRVYTIERYNQLSETAQANIAHLDLPNIEYCIGDGSKGWPEHRRFDRIIATAAMPKIPQPLIDQLKPDGLIIAPVGTMTAQELILARKTDQGLKTHQITPVRFVPLLGEYSFNE